ncbi:mucin-2 [Drosophila montana]|uniref:mucin-2 n=1 Tax=Drosophila montana TaxID=40370 RepID=UPI00313C8F33
MGVKKHISETPLSKSNSVDLYRPPALRHNSSEEASAPAATNETLAESEATTTTTTAIISTTTSVARKRSPPREQQASAAAAATRRERRPDRAVYVPRARRSQTTPPTTTTATAITTTMPTPMPMPTSTPTPTGAAAAPTSVTCNPQQLPQPLDMPVVNTNSSKPDDGNGNQAKPKKSRSRRERGKKTVGKTIEPDTLLVIAPSENQANQVTTSAPPPDSNCDKETMGGAQRTKTDKTHSNGKQQQHSLRIEDAALPRAHNAPTTEDANKCDNDVRELQRASKEINRSNRRIMKQTFVSDVLEIPEMIEASPKNSAAATATAATTAAASITLHADSTTEDDDEENEDDWENMFDENGDCLNPKILQELTESVGKCKIELPKMDYSVYHIKQSLLNEEEFPHVLEISNFPMEFKTPDLLMLFSQYKSAGFDIKWVDDTHALAVFSSSRIAAEVLTMGHPFVKLKPLAEATLESRLKAKKAGATSLQPYRQRPETCTALARRLVSGALGVKLPTAPEERENERRVLREAKERKLLAAKQRDEVWES